MLVGAGLESFFALRLLLLLLLVLPLDAMHKGEKSTRTRLTRDALQAPRPWSALLFF